MKKISLLWILLIINNIKNKTLDEKKIKNCVKSSSFENMKILKLMN